MATKKHTPRYIDPTQDIAHFWTAKPAATLTTSLDEMMNSDTPTDEGIVIPGKQCCAVRDGVACERDATIASASGRSFYCSQHGHCLRLRCGRDASEMVLWESRGFYVCPCVIEMDLRIEAEQEQRRMAMRSKQSHRHPLTN